MTIPYAPTLRRAAALPIGLVLASLAMAGCGHSSSSAAAGQSSTSSSASVAPGASSSSTAPAYTPLTTTQLAALLPTAAALPGWKATPSSSTANDPATAKQDAELAACVGSPNSDTLKVAQASTPDFTLNPSGASQVISADVTSYKTTAAVTADVAALKNSRYPACFKKELAAHGAQLFGGGYTYVSSTVTVTPGTTAMVAGRIDSVVKLKSATGKPLAFAVTEVALVGPGVEESVTFVAAGKPVSAAVAARFLTQAEKSLASGTSTGGA
ncbi:hypothetical protein M6D93_11765 [Jatrophihabitans telluris]|uniref:PknH-like extracellular domain-containing protein n=1 Tax=Jatrophihabitans telluris TaxID=2038343 RepID=A0ABY4QUK9_9ACTN|nr:hypothetical protein [Jatrophihabitans telluris]UQX86983.1 hypothetical protein M6D93_11765 [Jatrophihabitans telluris]